MTSDYFPLKGRFLRNNCRDGRNNTCPVDARARRPKWFSEARYLEEILIHRWALKDEGHDGGR